MCLHKITFSLNRNDEGEYVGKGYKVIDIVTRWDGKELDKPELVSQNRDYFYAQNEWMQTNPAYQTQQEIWEEDNLKYYPGFHIFLNLDDARAHAKPSGGNVFEVEYQNVLAFGPNLVSVSFNEDGAVINKYGDCIVAQKLRILDEVK
jgi:hypothetical protein